MSSRKIIFLFSVWTVYGIVSFLSFYYHEPSHDEAQYWIVARDMNLSELLAFCKFSGHPFLWFIILMPFAKTGFSFSTAGFIHWVFMLIASSVFIFRSHFPIFLKIFFCFSYYMIYHYVADIRDYNLTAILLFLIASVYPFRFKKKMLFVFLVSLLFNSNIHTFGAASALMITYLFEAWNKKILNKVQIPLCVMGIGGRWLVYQLFPSDDMGFNTTIRHSIFPSFNLDSIWNILMSVQNAFVPILPRFEELKVALLFFLFFLLLLVAVSDKKPVLFFLLASFLWAFYLFVTRYPGEWRHQGLLLIFVIFSLWIYHYYPKAQNFLPKASPKIITPQLARQVFNFFIGFCLFISAIFGLRTVEKEVLGAFSGAREAGIFISDNIPEKEIACYPSFHATAVAPYIPDIKLWFVDRLEYGTYFTLDSVFLQYAGALTEEQILSRCAKKYGIGKNTLLLLNNPLTEESKKKYRAKLLFKNKTPLWTNSKEIYWLYRITFPDENSY